jgi:uncharacterized protein
MSRVRLPRRVDPLRLAQRGERLEGTLPLADLARLREATSLAQGEVVVELNFGIDDQGVRYLKGTASTQVTLECQRCLQPMDYPLEVGLSLGLVDSLAAGEGLPEPYEPLLSDRRLIELSIVIEDELLLALPMIALHPQGECSPRADDSRRSDEPSGPVRGPSRLQ